MSKFKKILSSLFIACSLFCVGINCNAAKNNFGLDYIDNNGSNVFSKADVPTIVSNVIKIIMGLSATVMLVVIIITGIKFLTSGGDSGKTKQALNTIKNASIGIILIVAAYSLSQFIINNITYIASK